MGRISITSREARAGPRRPLVWALLCLIFLSGCGETSFLGRQYTNLTAYYNTFYNAKTAFEEGVTAVEESERSVDRTEYVSVFLEPRERGAEESFKTAVEKSAEVLREYPNSKWVDDALLMIGKSYYYLGNHIGAAQKFREVIALDSDRSREARFWLARTLVTNEQYSAAAEALQVGAEDGSDGPWGARLQLVRGELLVGQERWEEAADALRQGLGGDVPNVPASRGMFLLGQVLETMDRPTDAESAYRRVQEYDPSYPLSIAARLSEIELQGTHGDASTAHARLEDLEEDDKNVDQRGEMALVRARIYRAHGQYDEARRTLRRMLYGEEPPSRASKGRLHYDLATLYRSAYRDFSRAAAHFDTASSRLQQPGSQDGERRGSLPGAPVDAEEEADRYRNLAERSREVSRLDSLLRIGRMSDQEFNRFVEALRRKRQAGREGREEQGAAGNRLQRRGDALVEQRREAASAAETRSSDAGFLFYQDPTRVQEGQRRFRETWGDRPRVDNWRRRNAIRSYQRTAQAEAEPASEPTSAADSAPTAQPDGRAPRLNLSDVPRDSASRAEMESERALARYELANSLFLAAGQPDSAATLYRQILQENGDHPVAKRALYALAEAHRARGDSVAATQAYLRLIQEYPNTDLAGRARERLGRESAIRSSEVPVRADSIYAQAYQKWQEGQWQAPLDEMLTLVQRYPTTRTAPRALLAAGVIYWQRVQTDTSRAPRSLVQRHLSVLRGSGLADTVSMLPSSVDAPTQPSAPTSQSADTLAADTTPPTNDAESDQRSSPQPVERRGPSAVDSLAGGREILEGSSEDTVATDSVSGGNRGSEKEDRYAPLTGLFSHLITRYSESRYADRARSLLDVIEQRHPLGTVDSSRTIASDSLQGVPMAAETARRTEERSAVDARESEDRSTSTEPPTDEAEQEERTTRPESEGVDSTDRVSRNDDPRPASPGGQRRAPAIPDTARSAGSWTLLVDRFSSVDQANSEVERLRRELGEQWAVELLRTGDEGSETYELVVGRFATRRSATRMQKHLSADLEATIEVQRWPAQQRYP